MTTYTNTFLTYTLCIDLITLFICSRVFYDIAYVRPCHDREKVSTCLSMHNYSLSMLVTFDIYYYSRYIYICVCACLHLYEYMRFCVTVLCVCMYVCIVYTHTYNDDVYSLLLLLTYCTCRRNARNWLLRSDPPNWFITFNNQSCHYPRNYYCYDTS